ncbi:AGAP000015-PA-like protein [Anopheles sinensis]|uniref:Tyrosine-protein kinase receptor n=1 Tax=Anopheles sinensis TaxID=74873 RepID=A0A084VIV3_ANOSI|nr:AGAP000015-PA-like protein [Anopheles sinensis]
MTSSKLPVCFISFFPFLSFFSGSGTTIQSVTPKKQNNVHQNQTSFTEHIDASCGNDCYIKQNITNQDILEAREWSCIMGCNDGLNQYFRWLKAEIGTPQAPALVADSLTATALSLEWEVPERLLDVSLHRNHGPRSYLVQWRYEEVAGDWKYCRNQSMGENSTVRVDNLQPYTKYRFRVALLLSPKHDQVLTSEQSVIISTLPSGVPTSRPRIVRAVAVDHSRISISWEPGPFPNGPVLSYVLQIKELHPIGYSAIKDITESSTTRYYIFEKLDPERNYSVSVAMRNPEGEGPASITHVTTPVKPKGLEENFLPTLILGAERSILAQSYNMFTDAPTSFYSSPKQQILGTATHIRRGLIFVSDEAGYIYRVPSKPDGEHERVPILTPSAGNNFRPTLLSVDWLNDHLYILGQVRNTMLWQISRCDFDGGHLMVAIAGLQRGPDYFEVDPFNGYLFWVIGGSRADSGLFRLDLGDISNGVKHEIKPQQIVPGRNFGAFAIDHTEYRVLIADQNLNTVLSVSLDGKQVENIRNNTQQPRFEKVKSLALANGLFYWTNGTEVFAEDYHKVHNSYYHNAFPIASNNTYFSISVNLTSEQPIPISPNPPRNVQALVSPDKIKISWDVPYLLGMKGKGAWQAWRYRVELADDELFSTVIHTAEANGTSYVMDIDDRLQPNRVYAIRAAAFTLAGLGSWSSVFRVRTLRTKQQRHLVWASADGIMRSDVIGENVSTMIGRSAELDGSTVTNLAWYNDTLYVVSNSTLRLYRAAPGGVGGWVKFRELESIECVTIDPIGERLYFSNPATQMIVRAGLHGEQHEPIHSVMNVRELRFDAQRGFIYCSSGLILEAFRLNGKNRVQYFGAALFNGKQILGMTLDVDGQKVFWIVRSYQQSHLYWAPLAGTETLKQSARSLLAEEVPVTTAIPTPAPFKPNNIQLTDLTSQGPLLHFSDRLLWLKESQVVIGDLRGENLAYIRSHQLNGTRAFALIDAGEVDLVQRAGQRGHTSFNVLPATVDSSTIRVTGDWRRFNVSWAPVQNVNYTSVFYKLILKLPGARDIVQELTVPYFVYGDGPEHETIAPYTAIDITLHAFTYWRSSGFATTLRHTPAGKPSVPVDSRAFVHYRYREDSYELYASIVFRWSPPLEPNGPIVAYRVDCWTGYNSSTKSVLLDGERITSVGGRAEIQLPGRVHPNTTYYLQVRVCNVDHESEPSAVRWVSLREPGQTLPLLYVATMDQILLFDLDRGTSSAVVSTAIPATLLAELRHERKLLWVNVNGELFINDDVDGKRKLMQIPPSHGKVTALTVDWIARTVYMRVQAPTLGSNGTLHVFDLNRFENGGAEPGTLKPIVLPADPPLIDILQPFPEHRTLLAASRESRSGYILSLDPIYQQMGDVVYFNCSESDGSTEQHAVCDHYREIFDSDGRQAMTQDTSFLYWIANGTVQIQARQYENHTTIDHANSDWQWPQIEDAGALLPVQYQPYPRASCLVPAVHGVQYRPSLHQATENSLTLILPAPETHANCSMRPPGIRYRIQYRTLSSTSGQDNELHVTESYIQRATIGGLRPFTKYVFWVTLLNYYTAAFNGTMGLQIDAPDQEPTAMSTIFSTAAGAPSKPENMRALSISPSEAIVSWRPPRQKNNDRVWYEIYWETETSGRKNRQQQRVIEYTEIDDILSMNLTRLQPDQTYSIGIRAYSTSSTFSDSEAVEIRTFPEPEDIELLSINSTGMRIYWEPPVNAHRYKLQYAPVGTNNWLMLYDSHTDIHTAHTESMHEKPRDRYTHELNELLPKTLYRFSILIYYPDRDVPYMWPREAKQFGFETLADKPGTPGRPVVTQLRQDVYKVSWTPAKDNGAVIEEYGLEALVRNSKRAVRSVEADPEPEVGPQDDDADNSAGDGSVNGMDANSTTNVTAIASEPEFVDEHWSQVYNGTDIYWIIPERHAIHNNLFRVRARNSFGWGPYSEESRPIGEELSSERAIAYVVAFITALVTVVVIVFTVMIFCLRQAEKRKNFPTEPAGGSRLPDVELAILRELPRRGNFIQSTNILYSSGSVPDSEMALLPHIRRDQISIEVGPLLGSGAFGEVNEGLVKGVDGEIETRVAIKTLKKGAKEHEKQEFLQEAQLMSNFKHKHITRLLGVCIDGDELMIVMELMQGGDLLSYLRRSRSAPGQAARLTMLDLISMCQDVASGCRYLEEMHFVHRDLACRNCLVSSVDPRDRVVKIGDFGLARDIYKNDYYRKEGEGLLPVRWMSPESLVDGVFTSQSDIWAFGVLLWEIMTLGEQPYQAKNNVEVLHHVREGGHLDRPKVCPNEMYELMKYCWRFSPEQRPTFRYCLEVLKALRENTSEDTQIIAPFPAKLQQEAVSNPGYLVSEPGNNAFPAGTLRYRQHGECDPALLGTPPTSSSGSSGAAASVGGPKYLELLYEDSNEEQHSHQLAQLPPQQGSPAGQEKVPILVPPTDNGYEIPITDKRCQAALARQLQESAPPPVRTASPFVAGVSGTVDACSSLDPLLPVSINMARLFPDRYVGQAGVSTMGSLDRQMVVGPVQDGLHHIAVRRGAEVMLPMNGEDVVIEISSSITDQDEWKQQS